MGAVILSIIIFGVGLYFFLITNKKISQLKEDLITKEARDEMGSLIAEFNRVAERNINLIEDRIEVLQGMIQKANQKLGQLDEKVARVARPVVVEKVVGETPRREDGYFSRTGSIMKESQPEDRVELSRPREIKKAEPEKAPEPLREIRIEEKHPRKADVLPQVKDEPEKPMPKKKAPPVKKPENIEARLEETASRSDRLKALLRQGKSREELVDMGYMENEINLLSFIIRKE